MSFRGDESCADELRQRIRHGAVDQAQRVSQTAPRQFPRRVERLHVRLGKVLHLHQPSRPASRATGAVELQQPSDPAVRAKALLHCRVFLDRRFAKLLPDLQHTPRGCAFNFLTQQFGDLGFPQRVKFFIQFDFQPDFEFCDAVRIIQPGQGDRFIHQPFGDFGGAFQRAAYQSGIALNAAGIDDHIGFPLLLHLLRHGEGSQLFIHSHFGDNVLPAVFLE